MVTSRATRSSPCLLLNSLIMLLFLRETSCSSDSASAPPPKLRDLVQDLIAKIELIADGPPPSSVPPKVIFYLFHLSMGRVFYPIGYGADPTGKNDSTEAIQSALNDAFNQLNNQSLELMPGVKDAGGAVIDLQGGSYRISKPITFPPSGGGNLLFKEGSLRASPQFPPERFLVELISPKSELLIYKTDDVGLFQGVGVYYEDITFRDILFDSAFRGGGILVVDTARVRITNSYFLNFTSKGILVQGGHETFISTCFLGQHPTVGNAKGEEFFSGTGIDLASNDNIVSDTVLFSSKVGLFIRGQSNLIIGVHTYNKMKRLGGVGIYLKREAWYNRIQSCFIDFNSLVIEDPHYVHVTGNFFYGDANVILKPDHGEIKGFTVAHNLFVGWGSPIVEVEEEFTRGIEQVRIENNQARNMTMKSTVAKMTVAGNGTRWVADFSEQLVFPDWIKNFQYSVMEKPCQGRRGGPGWMRVTDVSRNVVVVESDEAIDAVVSVAVDQYNPVGIFLNK
ncbi:Polygalacturonase QRT3 [Linum perenne]